MKILLAANWGMGLKILKSIEKTPVVSKIFVVTQYAPVSRDPWKNAVYDHSLNKKHMILPEDELSFQNLIDIIDKHKIDLMMTHAFMRKIPESVFSRPKKGCVNIHASLLPKLRGPSPAQWVLKNKHKETGLTSHFIDSGMDTGDIIYQVKFAVQFPTTLDAIIEEGKKHIPGLIHETLKRICDMTFLPVKQNDTQATYAPRLG